MPSRTVSPMAFTIQSGFALAARRSAGRILAGCVGGMKFGGVAMASGYDQKIQDGEQAGGGLRPLGSGSAAAAMIFTAAVSGCDGRLGNYGLGGCRLRSLCHSMMTRHRWLHRTGRKGIAAAAAHGARLKSAGHRQRLVGRREHDEQEKSRTPAVKSPHLRKDSRKNSCQLPVASCQ